MCLIKTSRWEKSLKSINVQVLVSFCRWDFSSRKNKRACTTISYPRVYPFFSQVQELSPNEVQLASSYKFLMLSVKMSTIWNWKSNSWLTRIKRITDYSTLWQIAIVFIWTMKIQCLFCNIACTCLYSNHFLLTMLS